MKYKNYLSLALSTLFIFASCSFAIEAKNNMNFKKANNSYIKADVQSRRIPTGTVMKLKMRNSIDSYLANEGDPFSATLIEDIKVDSHVLLPVGTTVRGVVSGLKRTSLPSSSAEIILSFDHVVTPTGRLIPVSAKVANNKNLTLEGKLSSGVTYLTRADKNFNQGMKIVSNATSFGVDKGKSMLKGYSRVITVPVAATGGAVAGTATFLGKSIYDLFRKGEDVVVGSGQNIDIVLVQPLDVPLN